MSIQRTWKVALIPSANSTKISLAKKTLSGESCSTKSTSIKMFAFVCKFSTWYDRLASSKIWRYKVLYLFFVRSYKWKDFSFQFTYYLAKNGIV